MSDPKALLKRLARTLSLFKPVLESVAMVESRLAARWASAAHHRLYLVQWGMPPYPEFFYHTIDLYWQWRKTRRSDWLERGVYSTFVLKPNSRTLELGCGDGFNTYHFYSGRAKEVVALDFDPVPLAYAKRRNSAPNIEYYLGDMRTQMPEGSFDNVIWDAVFAYFTEAESHALIRQIKNRLGIAGILSGTTQIALSSGKKYSLGHVNEVQSQEKLRQFLSPYFCNVTIFETVYPDRHNVYFWASDGPLPFTK